MTAASPPRSRNHRPHRARRLQRITIAYDEQEYQAILRAAWRAHLAVSGFVAEAALSAAHEGSRVPGQDREALRELIAARSQVRRYGNNVNQAVRAFHSIGQLPPWLFAAIRLTDQAVRRIDQAAGRLAYPTAVPAPAGAPSLSRPSRVPPDTNLGGLR